MPDQSPSQVPPLPTGSVAPPTVAVTRGTKLRRCCITVAGLAVLVALFHPLLLRGLAGWLIVDDGRGNAKNLLIHSGDQCFMVAADWLHQDPEATLLMIRPQPSRLVQMGITPPALTMLQAELIRRDVPESRCRILEGVARHHQDVIRMLGTWLTEHPGESIVLLCGEFDSARQRALLNSGLKEPQRVRVVSLPDRRYTSTDWWKSRTGLRSFALATLALVDVKLRGGAVPPQVPRWDPDAYEQALRTGKPIQESPSEEGEDAWLAGAATWLNVGSEPAPVDHVVVLPGNQNTRPFAAAAVFNAGLAKNILIPRNFPSPQEEDGSVLPTHEITKKILLKRGVPEDAIIVLQMPSDKTLDDARSAAEVIDAHPDHRVAVVTNDYHTRRARLVFRNVFGSRADRFLYLAIPDEGFRPQDWWKSDVGTVTILGEYIKLFTYWLAYAYGWVWLLTASVVIITLGIRWRRKRAAKQQRPVRSPASLPTA